MSLNARPRCSLIFTSDRSILIVVVWLDWLPVLPVYCYLCLLEQFRHLNFPMEVDSIRDIVSGKPMASRLEFAILYVLRGGQYFTFVDALLG